MITTVLLYVASFALLWTTIALGLTFWESRDRTPENSPGLLRQPVLVRSSNGKAVEPVRRRSSPVNW